MNNPAPGFAKHPNHTVEIIPFDGNVTIEVGGQRVGQTNVAQQLFEASYPAVFYLPLDAIPSEMLEPNDHQTWCPFKGHASYFDLVDDGKRHENAVWTYREPFDEALAIKDMIAVYPNVATVKPA